MPGEPTYVVAGRHAWNRRAFDEVASDLPGHWVFVAERDELTEERLAELDPRYVFFLHWSWIVPAAITERWECVCFHMTDVPFGRGGSPLQNLIQLGLTETRLSALRMTAVLDAGPVYAKVPLALDGRAEEIYLEATRRSLDLAQDIARREPVPEAQEGDVVAFERRRPEQSALPESGSLGAVHDFIRMLDADGYPRAFLRHGPLRLEFDHARVEGDRLHAQVTVTVVADDGGPS